MCGTPAVADAPARMCRTRGCCGGRAAGATTIFRHFYADDATPEGLAARTLELTRSATVIKLTPDPYFMTLSFGGRAAPRERNDVRPALAVAPVPPEAGARAGAGRHRVGNGPVHPGACRGGRGRRLLREQVHAPRAGSARGRVGRSHGHAGTGPAACWAGW